MADAQDSKSCEGNFMRVRPPLPAPYKNNPNRCISEFGLFTNEYFGLNIKIGDK